MICWDNQSKYVWGKDMQEDLLELSNETESIDRVNFTDESVKEYPYITAEWEW